MSTLFLLASLVGAWFTFNVYRPMRRGSRRGVVSFFAAWLTGELALHQIAWQVAATAIFVALGGLSGWQGWLALAISGASWAALGASYGSARHAEAVVEEALCAGLGSTYREGIRDELRERLSRMLDWREILLPFPMHDPAVERVRDIVYGRAAARDLKLDLYRSRSGPMSTPTAERGAPILLQVHGGAWVVGSKNEQGVPLMLRMAAHGWLCVSIDYRLSPVATFPDHLVDVKRAIAWLRQNARQWGGDPDFIVVTGGSAGGHLASLAALTPNQPSYQPGFEDVDTTLAACVSFYGVYDFADPRAVYPDAGMQVFLERWVMKASREEAPEAYDRASPIRCVSEAAPPFFVLHGDLDTLVPVNAARHFVEALRRVSRQPVVYAELRGAQHAFEIFPSLRCVLAIDGVERFLFWVHDRGLGVARPIAEIATDKAPLPAAETTSPEVQGAA